MFFFLVLMFKILVSNNTCLGLGETKRRKFFWFYILACIQINGLEGGWDREKDPVFFFLFFLES